MEKEIPIDGATNLPIPEWPMRQRVMGIIEKVKSGEKTIALAREELIYLIRETMPPQEKSQDDIKYDEFVRDLARTINKHSREIYSNTPDYILAEFLAGCLTVFENTKRMAAERNIQSSRPL